MLGVVDRLSIFCKLGNFDICLYYIRLKYFSSIKMPGLMCFVDNDLVMPWIWIGEYGRDSFSGIRHFGSKILRSQNGERQI